MIVDVRTSDIIKKGDPLVLGAWATFDDVNLVATDMRQKMAILSQFKPTTAGPFSVIEVEIIKPVKANIGFVGRQLEPTGALLRGGGTQIHFDDAIIGGNRNTFLKIVSQPRIMN